MLQHRWTRGVLAFVLASGLPAVAEGPVPPRTLACAEALLNRLTRPRPTTLGLPFTVREGEGVPRPPLGARALRTRVRLTARLHPLAGTWVFVPVNAPFARDTYTSLAELQDWLNAGDSPERVLARLKLPTTLARDLPVTPYARDLARRLAHVLYLRGRRLICFEDEGGRL